MKIIANLILTFILALILSILLPWWAIMLAALIAGLIIPLKRFSSFLIPFVAVALFWMGYSFWLWNANDFILAQKIAILLPLAGNAFLLILVTGIVGGLAAGIAGLLGSTSRNLFN